MEPVKAARIETGASSFDVVTSGHSYSVTGFCVTDGNGRARVVRGCGTARGAFADAKHIARLANKRKPGTFPDPAQWRLVLL